MTKSAVLLILMAALVAVVFEDVGRRTVAGLVTETLTITDRFDLSLRRVTALDISYGYLAR